MPIQNDPMMNEEFPDHQKEQDFKTLTEAERIKAHPERHMAAIKHHMPHVKKVFASIKDMSDSWQKERNDKSMSDHAAQEMSQNLYEHLKNKSKDAAKVSDHESAEADDQMGTNAPTGDKLRSELPRETAAKAKIRKGGNPPANKVD